MRRYLLFAVLLACCSPPSPIVQPVRSEGAEAPAAEIGSTSRPLETASDSEPPAASEPLATAALTISQPVDNALSGDQIQTVIQAHIREVRDCYERSLAHNRQLQGRVRMEFEISATGAVSRVEFEPTTFDEEVQSCLRRVIQRWTFPEPIEGGVVVRYAPF